MPWKHDIYDNSIFGLYTGGLLVASLPSASHSFILSTNIPWGILLSAAQNPEGKWEHSRLMGTQRALPFPSLLGLGRFSLRRVRTNLEKQRNRTFVLGISKHHPSDAHLPFLYPAEFSFKCYFFLTYSHRLRLFLINNIKKIPLLLLMEFSALYTCVLKV